MAVYKRTYAGYSGKITPRRSRFLILTRYAARGLFQSRIVTGLFIISFIFPLFTIAALYLNQNAHLLTLLRLPSVGRFVDVDGKLFMGLMTFQGSFAFLITKSILSVVPAGKNCANGRNPFGGHYR